MLRGSDFYDFLFVNSIHSNIKYCFFSGKICCAVVIWEGYGYFYFISWMSSDELIFKIINIASGTNHKVCSLSISTSAIKSCSIDLTYIINIYSISILNCQRCICTVGRCFRCCCGICCFCYLRVSVTSSVSAASSVGAGVAVGATYL